MAIIKTSLKFDSKHVKKKRLEEIKGPYFKAIFVLTIIVVWQVVAYSRIYPQALFPPVEDILSGLFSNAEILKGIFMSLSQVFMALFLSLMAVGGMLFLTKVSPLFQQAFDLCYTIFSPIPSVAILPLVILWFGLTTKAIVFLMFHATLWPLWIQLKLNQDRLTARFFELESAFPISLRKRLFYIYFLGSIPDLLVGLQNGFNRGWRAIISIEMIFGMVGQHMGIGWLIYERRMMMDTVSVYSGVLGIMICGIIMDHLIFNTLKKRLTIRWDMPKIGL